MMHWSWLRLNTALLVLLVATVIAFIVKPFAALLFAVPFMYVWLAAATKRDAEIAGTPLPPPDIVYDQTALRARQRSLHLQHEHQRLLDEYREAMHANDGPRCAEILAALHRIDAELEALEVRKLGRPAAFGFLLGAALLTACQAPTAPAVQCTPIFWGSVESNVGPLPMGLTARPIACGDSTAFRRYWPAQYPLMRADSITFRRN